MLGCIRCFEENGRVRAHQLNISFPAGQNHLLKLAGALALGVVGISLGAPDGRHSRSRGVLIMCIPNVGSSVGGCAFGAKIGEVVSR